MGVTIYHNPRCSKSRQTLQLLRDAGLDDESLSRAALIGAMAANPVLIEPPIVVKGDTAVLGRPPDNVLALV